MTFFYNESYPCEGTENCNGIEITNEIQMSVICYSIVFLLGIPGNGLVVWVTAFRMPNSVNAQWFLNLAIADLLCCLLLPFIMVPLAQDQYWPFGDLACKLLNGLFYMRMYCSVLLLVVISLDRFLLVTKPVWCQNHRHPRQARCVCFVVWILALLGGSPFFSHMETFETGKNEIFCVTANSSFGHEWSVTLTRGFLSFLLPFLIICASHWKVYCTMSSGRGQRGSDKPARTLRVILALVLNFFLCWSPLQILDLLLLILYEQSESLEANLHLAYELTLCLACINSCLNPLLYLCLGWGFKKNLVSSLRSVLHFESEAPTN